VKEQAIEWARELFLLGLGLAYTNKSISHAHFLFKKSNFFIFSSMKNENI
jgi:hypothetical protein